MYSNNSIKTFRMKYRDLILKYFNFVDINRLRVTVNNQIYKLFRALDSGIRVGIIRMSKRRSMQVLSLL